jgi:hypothetical protein
MSANVFNKGIPIVNIPKSNIHNKEKYFTPIINNKTIITGKYDNVDEKSGCNIINIICPDNNKTLIIKTYKRFACLILLSKNAEIVKINIILAISTGCSEINPKFNHPFVPLLNVPNIRTELNKRSDII